MPHGNIEYVLTTKLRILDSSGVGEERAWWKREQLRSSRSNSRTYTTGVLHAAKDDAGEVSSRERGTTVMAKASNDMKGKERCMYVQCNLESLREIMFSDWSDAMVQI